MRIALMGTRGIPANYGGFETFYENLGPGLAARGHDVTVYIRPHAVGKVVGNEYRGVHLVRLPSITTKHLETITHTLASVLHGLSRRYDVVYVCGVGNTPLVWIPRLRRARVVLNVDSADWKRRKWGRFAATYLHATERFAARAADVIVADSKVIQARYAADYGADARFFPYGANLVDAAGTDTLVRYGLRPRRYVLWVGRLEPEANVEELIRAFASLGPTDYKLVIVGDSPYAEDYREKLKALATADVVFTGYQFGDAYRELGFHAFAYVQTSPTSGTSPALLDQMAAGGAVIVRGTPTNLEVIADTGLAYDPKDGAPGLGALLKGLISDPASADRLRAAARSRVATVYSWDRIIDDYERLFAELLGRAGPASASSDRRE
jgi:glycosyltransferase involved in cell wall biosynthesis